ncbi:MAG: GreA/GreB family elongation factor [Verrucomicrobiales bacterium]|nr:GreA/GreB family elongation factor [Verrucomicrobiales bacterium]
MREEFEKLAAAGKLQSKHIDPLVMLAENRFCTHKSWGFGQIKTVDIVFSRFTIDFPGKAGHNMDLGFAAESLKPIPKEHILARKIADPNSLRQMAALHHLDLIKLVLESFGGHATIDQIQQVLVPDVIQDDWKKWWDVAKHEMKKSGHFQLPVKKSDPITYQAKETSLQDRLMAEFRAAKGLKARTIAAVDIQRSLSDLTDKQAAAKEVVQLLNSEIATHLRTQPSVTLEAIFVRDDLREGAGLPAGENEVTTKSLWTQESNRFGQLLEQLPAVKHRRALVSFKDANPALWHEALLATINNVSNKLATEFVHILIQGGKLAQLKETVGRLVSHHQANTDLLLWLAKERSDDYADILGPEVFRAMLTAMERDQFNEKRSNKLRDFILDDQALITDLLGSADLEIIKDVTRTLQLSLSFDDMDKRSLLARIVKSYPAVQVLISGGEASKQEATHVVSWESLERRRLEYNELVHKTIPANSKEIAIARSYGDLRENHEYKAAKEMQKFLMGRKVELERDLDRARGSDFANPKTDVVGIGTKVVVTDLQAKAKETFILLGAWDSDPDKNIVSYLTPLAQALFNKKPGEEVEFELEGTKKQYRIETITDFRA